eukprot:s209_g6.t2
MAAALGSGESSLSIETSSAKDVQQGSPYLDYEQLVLNSNKEGMDFLRKGQYKQAFEQLKYAEAVVVSKQGKDEATNLMSVTCNNLGCYYKKVGKLHAALSYLRKALKIEVSLQTDDVTVAGTHLNVCAILSKLDKHDKALQHALCALELIKHRVDSVESTTQDEYSVLAIAYHNVAVERDYLQQLQEAAAAYQQGHEVAKKCLGDQHPLTQTLAKNANAALQKSQAKAAQAEVERNRSPPAPREARPRKNSTPQVTTLPEISRAKEPSQDGLEEEVSRDQSFGSWNAPALGGDAGGFLPPLQPQPSSSPSVSQAYTAAEVAAPPSFIETMGPEARAAPPSPPPLIIEQRKDEESMVQEPEQRHGRPPRSPRSTDGAPTRPPRTRNRKPDPAVGHRETEAGLVPAAQQSQILRRSAAEKIQHFWRQYQRHKVQSCDQNRIENAAATKIQATFRAFAVRRSRRTKAATAIQRHLRGFLVRIALRRHQAAVVIQRHGIGFLTRKNLRSAVDAAVRIQRLARARIASINVEARRRLVKHAAKLVRGSIRTWLIREDLKQLRVLWAKQEAREESSLKIQSVWRGGCARQNVADMRSAHKKRIMLFRASARLQADPTGVFGHRDPREVRRRHRPDTAGRKMGSSAGKLPDNHEEYEDFGHLPHLADFQSDLPQNQEPLSVRIRMVNGDVFEFSALPYDTVRRLKQKVADKIKIPAHQQRLLLNTELLRDQLMLRDAYDLKKGDGVKGSSPELPELTLVFGPPIPSWGVEQGFDDDFTGFLREYFAKHSEDQRGPKNPEEQPPWMDHDVEIWERFRMSEEENLLRFSVRGVNNHFVQLWQHGQMLSCVIFERFGSQAVGWIHNCAGENSNHQLLLAVDTWVVGELYNGIPSWKENFVTNISFPAPKADGVYMLWRSGDVAQTMEDAKRSFEARNTRVDPELFPDKFVGWLAALARRHLAKKRVAKIRATQMRASHNAATTIRKMWLGHVYRRRYVALRKEFQEHEGSVVTLQRFARGYLVRLRMWRDAIRSEEQLWAAVEMQRCWRGYLGRLRWETEFERLWARESAAVMIQRNVRGWLARTAVTGRRRRRARAEFEKARRRFKAAQKIQALVRGVLCRKRVLRFWQRKVEAATTIQRIWRGHKLRCQKFEKDRTRDAVRIQSAARRFLVRNRRFQLLAKVIMISRQWRHWRHFIPEDWALRGCRCTAERERRRARSKLYREAATTIQRYVEAKNYAAGTEPQTSAIESAEP